MVARVDAAALVGRGTDPAEELPTVVAAEEMWRAGEGGCSW